MTANCQRYLLCQISQIYNIRRNQHFLIWTATWERAAQAGAPGSGETNSVDEKPPHWSGRLFFWFSTTSRVDGWEPQPVSVRQWWKQCRPEQITLTRRSEMMSLSFSKLLMLSHHKNGHGWQQKRPLRAKIAPKGGCQKWQLLLIISLRTTAQHTHIFVGNSRGEHSVAASLFTSYSQEDMLQKKEASNAATPLRQSKVEIPKAKLGHRSVGRGKNWKRIITSTLFFCWLVRFSGFFCWQKDAKSSSDKTRHQKVNGKHQAGSRIYNECVLTLCSCIGLYSTLSLYPNVCISISSPARSVRMPPTTFQSQPLWPVYSRNFSLQCFRHTMIYNVYIFIYLVPCVFSFAMLHSNQSSTWWPLNLTFSWSCFQWFHWIVSTGFEPKKEPLHD